MKKIFKKSSVSIAVSIVMAAGMLAACGKQPSEGTAKPAGDAAPSKAESSAPEAIKYPLQTQDTITSWEQINNNLITFFPNLADAPFGKELAKETGVKVKYTHPADGQSKDQFNLMIASNNLPDTIEYDWSTAYPGGPEKAISDKVILPLNDLIDKYAPNLKKLLQEDKELDKMVKTDSGQYYVFPMIRPENGLVYRGPMLRKDWLDSLGLAVPTTIDEWEKVLTAFKEKKGATAPFTAQYSNDGGVNGGWNIQDAFIGAFHTSNSFYVDDQGKVRYGPTDPQFKDALTLLNKWYAAGLIDKDFALNTDSKSYDSRMMTDSTGATVGLLGGGMGRWMDAGKKKDPKYELVAAPYPTLKKGEKPFTGQRSFKYNSLASNVITADSKHPELVAKWLDYGYSEAGSMLFNYGIENESYTMKDGKPAFTDKILKDSKYSYAQMSVQYTKPNGPFLGNSDKTLSANTYPEQNDAIKIWEATDAAKHILPSFITPTADESKEMAKIFPAIGSYKEEMFVKFVMGKEPLDKFDDYVKQINSMGIDKVTQIYQNALDRYNKR